MAAGWERRAVLNAVICGRDPFAIGLRRADVSWHLIWLEHLGLVRVVGPDRIVATTR